MKPWLQDAGSLADAIRRGEVRSADAVEASLLAIEDSDLNTVAYLDAESARAAAAEIDRRIAAGEDAGLFAGVPMLIKDVMHVRGWPTARGSVPLKENIVDYDSTQVERLRHAGAVFLGESNMSELDSSTTLARSSVESIGIRGTSIARAPVLLEDYPRPSPAALCQSQQEETEVARSAFLRPTRFCQISGLRPSAGPDLGVTDTDHRFRAA